MQSILFFILGAFAGALGWAVLIWGFSPWPAEASRGKRKHPGRRHSSDASWLS